MRKAIVTAVVFASAVGLAVAGSPFNHTSKRDLKASSQLSKESKQGAALISFESMYGVDGPFVGDGFPIRDIPGDELPWTLRSARGRLDTPPTPASCRS